MAQARAPAFFAGLGVADTPEGRMEMLIAHLYLVLDRLGREGAAGASLGRHLTEAFVTDIDDCLREMGVGDMAVPRKVKKAAAGLRERCEAYRRRLDAPQDDGLAAELAARVPGLETNAHGATALAHYMRQSRAHLATLAPQALRAGHVTFAAPEIDIGRKADDQSAALAASGSRHP